MKTRKMYKVRPVFHSGMEFVQILKLPAQQAEQLCNKIPSGSLMKIRIGEELLMDCISYDIYEQWYHLMGPQNYDNYVESQI